MENLVSCKIQMSQSDPNLIKEVIIDTPEMNPK